MDDPPFVWLGPPAGAARSLLSVPHAGRRYPPALLDAARVGADDLALLEDRLSDLLVAAAVAGGTPAIIALTPRAVIDLNRGEGDMDPDMLDGGLRRWLTPVSARARSGLGLVPRRLARIGELWRGPMARQELDRRIDAVHRPYHATLAAALERARRRFGSAVLVDVHSMPSLPARAGHAPVDLVIGDRFGQSADAPVRTMLADIATDHGLNVAFNHPYSGGHILATHGRPGAGVHAVQLEFDRALYLDGPAGAAQRHRDDGVARLQAVLAAMADALNDASSRQEAAE